MTEQLRLFSEPRVFGLYSPAMGSGKSEVAKVLVNEFGAKLVKFAGPLKDMTRTLLLHMGIHPSLVERHIEGDLKEVPIEDFEAYPWTPGRNSPQPLTARRIMQTLGTEWRDLISRDLWAKIAIDNIKEQLAKGHHVVVDDMRFEHELNTIKSLNGVTVRVFRPSAQVTSKHVSEGALEAFSMDHTIINNGTLDDLRAAVYRMISNYTRTQ